MSLCDSCYSPGACCKDINFYHEGGSFTFWDDTPVAEQTKEWENFPFEASEKQETIVDQNTGRSYSRWLFSCPHLQKSGRCGIYDSRPNTCRSFEPASNALCVHYRGAEGTGEGL